MERFIRNDSNFQLLFNCSFYNVSDLPLHNRKGIFYGLVLLLTSLVEMVFHNVLFYAIRKILQLLYLPCLVSIWRRADNSCFYLMFVMGILDETLLSVWAISGYLQLNGSPYCSSPTLIYIISCYYHCKFYNLLAINLYFIFSLLAGWNLYRTDSGSEPLHQLHQSLLGRNSIWFKRK
jgi:hypothetical protein